MSVEIVVTFASMSLVGAPADKLQAVALCRAHRYPPTTKEMAEKSRGIGAHTDFGALTLLLQDDCKQALDLLTPVYPYPPAPASIYWQLINIHSGRSRSLPQANPDMASRHAR